MPGGSAPGEPCLGWPLLRRFVAGLHPSEMGVMCVLGVTLHRAWLGACLEASSQAAAELLGL